jgi:hypothetical protein
MNEDQLRAMIREAVARHLGGAPSAIPPAPALAQSSLQIPSPSPLAPSLKSSLHPSHVQYLTVVNAGDACVIEPAVSCNHCGYCKCHGY